MERANLDMKTDTKKGDNVDSHVMTEAEIVVRKLQAKKCQGFMVIIRWKQEAKKDGFYSKLQRDYGPVDSLTLDFYFQNCEAKYFRCFKSSSSWKFVTAAQGN